MSRPLTIKGGVNTVSNALSTLSRRSIGNELELKGLIMCFYGNKNYIYCFHGNNNDNNVYHSPNGNVISRGCEGGRGNTVT